MNDKVYIQHQYDALTKNAAPLGLLDLAAKLKAFADSKLASISVHVTVEQKPNWESSDVHVRLEEGTQLSEAVSFLEDPAWVAKGKVKEILYFLDVSFEERHNANPEDIVQGNKKYAIYVTLTN